MADALSPTLQQSSPPPPFPPPQPAVAKVSDTLGSAEYAGFGARFLASLVDGIIVGAIYFILMIPVSIMGAMTAAGTFLNKFERISKNRVSSPLRGSQGERGASTRRASVIFCARDFSLASLEQGKDFIVSLPRPAHARTRISPRII